MQISLHHSSLAQNACALACTGYGTQTCCPPLIVIATTLNEEQKIRDCILKQDLCKITAIRRDYENS
jgi:predicted metal-binding protein